MSDFKVAMANRNLIKYQYKILLILKYLPIIKKFIVIFYYC